MRLVRKYQRPSHKHAGGEGLQLDGLDAQQEKIEHVGRECDDAALLERQHGDLVKLIFIFSSFLGSFQLWTSTINNVVCIKLPQVFGVSRYISAICRGCLLVKNSFVNISEVNRQCLHSLGI